MFSVELTVQGKLVKVTSFTSFSDAEHFAFEQSIEGYKAVVWKLGMWLSVWESGCRMR